MGTMDREVCVVIADLGMKAVYSASSPAIPQLRILALSILAGLAEAMLSPERRLLARLTAILMRAPRFPLQLTVRYRRTGDSEWHLGKSENISRSGILFRAKNAVEIDAPVELRIVLPGGDPASDVAEIWCRGRVVRTVGDRPGYSIAGFAVAIDQYDFVPSSVPFLSES